MEVTYALISVLIGIWIIWRWKRTSLFAAYGIPGPKPNFLFGNLIELYTKGPLKCHQDWIDKYGRIVGYYYGMRPVLLVADPLLLKNIFIKDFSKFINRELFNPLSHPVQTSDINRSVLSLRGSEWKEVRSVLTPTFSTAKMKQMSVTMNSSIEDMISILKDRAEKGIFFNIHDTYQRLTLEVIAKTAFGVQIDVQNNEKATILKQVQLIFRMPYRSPFVFLGLAFPLLRRIFMEMQFILLRILNRGPSPLNKLRNGLHEVLQYRKEHPKLRKPDLLQLMIDTKMTNDASSVDMNKLEAGHQDNENITDESRDDGKVVRYMSNDSIIASAVTVFLAGYETTSTALAFTTYLLGKYPDIQERAFEEIEELVENGGKLEYGTINQLPYLEKVFSESMRVYPPVYLFTNRYASEDITYGSLRIPKDVVIQAPTYQLHHDPDYWSDPETFDPSRFDTKPNANGMIYFPFGIGPRNCMGMRFAQMEAKLALAHTIYNFRIVVSEKQKNNLPTSERIRTLTPTNGVKVKLERRFKETS